MREKQKFHIWHYKKEVKIKLLPLLLNPFKLGSHCCSPGWFELPASLPFQPPECWDYQAWEAMHNFRSNYTVGKKACITCNVGHGAQSWVLILGLHLIWERVSVLMLALYSRLAGKPLGDSPSSHSAQALQMCTTILVSQLRIWTQISCLQKFFTHQDIYPLNKFPLGLER